MGRFSGKVAIVTGGASGMGLAAARSFAAEGAAVVLSDIAVEAGERAVREIVDGGGKAIFFRCDVSDREEAEALVDAAIEAFGRLDFAANLAGFPQGGGLYCPLETREKTIAINLLGTINCVTAQAKAMMRTGGGSIVNCSSVSGVTPHDVAPYYSASKAGLTAFSKSAALELAPRNVRVNVIAPGVTRTGMTVEFYGDKLDELGSAIPLGRVGESQEQADAVIWLCSDQASFVTGVLLPVDGGQTAGARAGTLEPSDEFVEEQG